MLFLRIFLFSVSLLNGTNTSARIWFRHTLRSHLSVSRSLSRTFNLAICTALRAYLIRFGYSEPNEKRQMCVYCVCRTYRKYQCSELPRSRSFSILRTHTYARNINKLMHIWQIISNEHVSYPCCVLLFLLLFRNVYIYIHIDITKVAISYLISNELNRTGLDWTAIRTTKIQSELVESIFQTIDLIFLTEFFFNWNEMLEKMCPTKIILSIFRATRSTVHNYILRIENIKIH